MTMCKLFNFKIDTTEVGSRIPLNEDKVSCYSLVDFSLEKKMLQPHELTFTLRRNNTNNGKNYGIINEILGKSISFTLVTSLKDPLPVIPPIALTTGQSKLDFKGTITKVTMKGINLSCVAVSNDSQLQGPLKCRCFYGKKLNEIIAEMIPASQPPVPDDLQATIDLHTAFNDKIFPYIVQYNESDYDFLVRLAKRFGAFFYLDQTNRLVFGKLPNNKKTWINAANAKSFSYEFQGVDLNTRLVAQNYEINKKLTSEVGNLSLLRADNLVERAVGASADKKDSTYDFFVDNPQSLYQNQAEESYNKALLGAATDELVVCKFVCYQFDFDLGHLISISNDKSVMGESLMLVTSIKYTWDCEGSPQSEVTTIVLPKTVSQVDTEKVFPPYMDLNAYPKSNAQRAKVINNVDPLKMGRIQVLFPWQKEPTGNNADAEKKKFPWIRIAQPYAGDKVGCYILPEIEDEVIVGFEHDNLEKPFVIGSLYHGAESENKKSRKPAEFWIEPADDGNKKNKANEVKAFRTKKGHTIEFHDIADNGKDGYIRIYNSDNKKPNYDIILSTDEYQNPKSDPKECYKMSCADDGAKAEEDIKEKEYEAKKLRIMVQSYGGDIMLDAGKGDIIMNAANIRINATDSRTTLIGKKDILKVKESQLVDVGSNSLVVQGEQKLMVKGDDKKTYKKEVSLTITEALKIAAKSLESKTDENTDITAKNIETLSHQKTNVSSQNELLLDGLKSKLKANGSVEIESTNSVKVNGNTGVVIDGCTTTKIKGISVTIDATTGTRKGNWKDI